MSHKTIYRFASLLMLFAILLAGCGPAATPTPVKEVPPPTKAAPETEAVPTEPPSKYSEAPDLAKMVEAGKLPPIEERLPTNPLVVDATEVGQYGGTWRMGMRGGTDDPSLYRILGYENLVRWTVGWDGDVLTAVKSWPHGRTAHRRMWIRPVA